MEYASHKARFSRCKKYRYTLERRWNEGDGKVVFIGLNPSTADNSSDDPTIRRCVGFARSWGFEALDVVNLFAFRATFPQDLLRADQPIGPRNNYWIKESTKTANLIIACWGTHGEYIGRANRVLNKLPDLHCIKMNSSGTPAHPLYLKADLIPVKFPLSDLPN